MSEVAIELGGGMRQRERKGNEGRAEMTTLVNLPLLLASSLGDMEGEQGRKGTWSGRGDGRRWKGGKEERREAEGRLRVDEESESGEMEKRGGLVIFAVLDMHDGQAGMMKK